MAEAVKVIVRCRPMNAREDGLKCKDVIFINERLAQCSIKNPNDDKGPPKAFTFDGAYGVNSTTQQIYAEIGFPLVEGVTEGYNGTIFAYGQTGSGKSFSMQGITVPATQKGVIPRAFDHVFEKIQVTEGAKYLVHASYLEIYNEEIRDLLGKDIKQKLELKEHPDKGVYVQSLSMHLCKNVRMCEQVMERGWKNRSTGATLMNADSSRSHSIFTIHLERAETDGKGEDHIRVAKLNLVDLAGSERQGKTGATGDRLKEATKINLSLSALGNVISALVDGKSTHIPYRDSKLTRMLQDSLGGNTKTLMVACLSPADNNYEETLSTLRYANRAKNIKNKPKINEDPKDALLREFQEEIKRLKAMLSGQIPVQLLPGEMGREKAKNMANRSGVNETNHKLEIEKAKQKIKEEFENEMRQLKEELSSVKASKDEVELQMNNLRSQYDEKVAEVENVSQSKQIKSRRSGFMEETETNFMRPDTFVAVDDDQSERTELATNSDRERDTDDLTIQSDEIISSDKRQMPASMTSNVVTRHPNDVMKRLAELEQTMVGGEEINNEEVKERHRKKKKFAEDRSKQLRDALALMDGEEIMIGIYENVQDQLRIVEKKLKKETERSGSLKCEIDDLQSEFELDRRDYLDTIRKQEMQIKWLEGVVDRIHPTLRSGCNFINLDRIRTQSKWDEDEAIWTMPKLTIEKVQLPSTNSGALVHGEPGDGSLAFARQRSSYQDLKSSSSFVSDPEEDFLRQKLLVSEQQQHANSYFGRNRAKELLDKGRQRSSNLSPINGSYSSVGATSAPLASRSSQPSESTLSSLRKPVRLESLPNMSVLKPDKKHYRKT